MAIHLAFGSSSHQHPLHLMTALPHKSETAARGLGCTAHHRLFAFLHASVMQSLDCGETSVHESERAFTQGCCTCCASTAAAASHRCTAAVPVNGVLAATESDRYNARPAGALRARLRICCYPSTASAKPGKKLRRESPARFLK